MKKRLFCVITIIALITTLFPLNIFAGNSVVLNTITSKYQGDSVTISGATVLDEVTVKVLRPNNTILYVNVLEGGSFTDTFTLPEDTALGTYTVIAGKGQEVATTTFKVISRSSSENNGGGSPTSTVSQVISEPEVEVRNDGTVKVITKPSLEGGSHTAVSTVSGELMGKALGQAKVTSEGVRVVVFEIPEVEGAENYTLQLPANTLSSGEEDVKIEIETPLGTIVAPGDMFNSSDLMGEGDVVELTIGLADRSGIPEDIKQQIGDRPVIELNAMAGGRTINWNNPDAPVTVSIDYTPTAEEMSDPEHIVVWYIDGQGNVVSVPNGRYDPYTGKVTFTTTHFSKYAVAFVKKTFSDIGNYPWAKKGIEVLASKGIINGTSATSYSPGLNITRADFVTLLVRSLELKAEFTSGFDDVKASDHYYNAAGIAKQLGITTGVGNNRFNPKAFVTREDMMVMAARAMKMAEKIKSDADVSVLSGYTDSGSISSYAKTSVATLVKNGIITGNNNLINPRGYTTRAEIAVVIYRIYNK